jgi:hypothetical protein
VRFSLYVTQSMTLRNLVRADFCREPSWEFYSMGEIVEQTRGKHALHMPMVRSIVEAISAAEAVVSLTSSMLSNCGPGFDHVDELVLGKLSSTGLPALFPCIATIPSDLVTYSKCTLSDSPACR